MDQAEGIRNVIKLQNQVNVSKARVVTITSGKGGVGKSSIAVNLAIQLRKLGKKVIIFDADLGLANVEVMFGAIPKYNLSDLIYQGKDIKEIITEGPMEIGFISGGSGVVTMNNLTKDQIAYLVHSLSKLDELADIIIVDTGAGVADNVLEFVIASPEVLLVTTPEPSSLTDSYSLLKALYRNPGFIKNEIKINVVANKVNSSMEGQMVFDKLDSVVSQFLNGTLNYFGMIPQDTNIEKAVRQQKTVSLMTPEANSSKAFEVLARNLVNDEQNLFVMKRGFSQLFSNILNKNK
ncbi:MAG: MinD/ParA family protein [Lachnospiraceae bacterium]